MGYNEDIEAAVAFLESLEIINFSEIIRDFKVNCIILCRRFLGILIFKKEAAICCLGKLLLE